MTAWYIAGFQWGVLVSPALMYMAPFAAAGCGASETHRPPCNQGFALMGLSLDNWPDWVGWMIFEAVFATVFVLEIVVKCVVARLSTMRLTKDSLGRHLR